MSSTLEPARGTEFAMPLGFLRDDLKEADELRVVGLGGSASPLLICGPVIREIRYAQAS